MASQAHNRKGFFPADIGKAKLRRLPVAAAQTLAAGDVVILSSSQVAIGLAGSAELCGVIAEPSVGQAAGTEVMVWADPETVFIARTNADTSVGAGAEVDLVGGTGAMEIDEDASSTDVIVLLGQVDPDETAAAGQRWYCKINKHAFAELS